VINDFYNKERLTESSDEVYQRIRAILKHAYNTTNYYKRIFDSSGVNINCPDEQLLEELSKLPFLTKDVLRTEGNQLVSTVKSKSYKNTSGGSTGEPIVFIQDEFFRKNADLTRDFVYRTRGYERGGKLVKIWGAERDTFKGRRAYGDLVKDFLKRRKIFNSFVLNVKIAKNICIQVAKFKPNLIVAYSQSLFEITKLLGGCSPFRKGDVGAVHTSAGVLTEHMREAIECFFNAPVYDHYGSREVSSIASQLNSTGYYTCLSHFNFVEIVDSNGKNVKPGQIGEVVVTNLFNQSMPLIRYKIGDKAMLSTKTYSPVFPLLEELKGRVVDVFVTEDNTLIDGEYFTHLLYFIDEIKKFQIVQHGHTDVEFLIYSDAMLPENVNQQLVESTKHVLGQGCNVKVTYTEEFILTPTGKHRYTISKVI